jgi:hypothetical protein
LKQNGASWGAIDLPCGLIVGGSAMNFRVQLGLFGLACLLAVSIVRTQEVDAQPKADPDTLFRRIDANGDGKISKEEWKKFSTTLPRLKDPKVSEFVFNRLDADRNGYLSPEEFKKIGEMRPGTKESEPKKGPAVNPSATTEQIAFFEKKIRPVLVKECYSCHSADAEKVRGNLTLDTRAGIREGGDSGPAVVPGDPQKSLLLKFIKHLDEKRKMPKDKLPDAVIADFEKWIAMGAPDPRGEARVAPAKASNIDIEQGRKFWAFQPPKKASPPAVNATSWPQNDIDRYLLASLEAKGLQPVADADSRALVRRLYFDLTGLPPTPSDVAEFVREHHKNPQAAVATVVDKLLASPRFGERWGRHWLDVARFAESSGKQANFNFPHAWRYRDYVIAAFNADMPYDRFVREQLAGDLLTAKDERERTENLVATGFLAIGPKSLNERVRLQFEMDLVDEQIDATFIAFQGLTVACARCHDHKFDPIPTKDYYALAGIFRSTETCYGTTSVIQNFHPSPLQTLPYLGGAPAGLPPLTMERRATLEKQLRDLKDQTKKTDKTALTASIIQRIQIANVESQLALYEADGSPRLLAMGVRDRRLPADSKVFTRGELDHLGETVKRGLPQVLVARQPFIRGSGRLELANWIASADNPLTARVMVNRVWLHLFGRGLVATPDNFGASGQLPSNPALLDHLATSFVDNGWSVKKLIRSIVSSRSYRLSSQFDERNFDADPENVLVWRMPKRRLEAEALRDAILSVSGKLDVNPPTGSPLSKGGEGIVNLALRFRGVEGFTSETHRSVYMPIIRDQLPESLTLFDFPDPTLITGERATTMIPAQSLFLLNNVFVIRQAEIAADNLLALNETDGERLYRAYRLFFSRPPSAQEEKLSFEFLERYGKALAAEKKSPHQSRRATWSALCQSLFASAEFCYR